MIRSSRRPGLSLPDPVSSLTRSISSGARWREHKGGESISRSELPSTRAVHIRIRVPPSSRTSTEYCTRIPHAGSDSVSFSRSVSVALALQRARRRYKSSRVDS